MPVRSGLWGRPDGWLEWLSFGYWEYRVKYDDAFTVVCTEDLIRLVT